jgi:hypothetical protein
MTNIFEKSAEQKRYDKTSPYQPIMRRNVKISAAGLKKLFRRNLLQKPI